MKNCAVLILAGLSIAILYWPDPLEAQLSTSAYSFKQSHLKNQTCFFVLEAYVKYMLAHHAHTNCVNFLRVSPRSKIKPTVQRKLIQRFTSHVPPVLKADTRIRYGPGFTDKITKKPAMIYDVDGVKWIDDRHVEVDGGWRNGGLSGISAKYQIELKGKRWSVSKEMEYAEN